MRGRNPCDLCVFCTDCDMRMVQDYRTIYGTIYQNIAITLKARRKTNDEREIWKLNLGRLVFSSP